MSININKVIIQGRLGADPESRATPGGNAVTRIRIATSEVFKDKESGERKEQTEWHSVVFFNKLAEIASMYLKKGKEVYVEGVLRTRKWQDKGGTDHYTTEIEGIEMKMGSDAPSEAGPRSAASGKPAAAKSSSASAPAGNAGSAGNDDFPSFEEKPF